MKKDIANRDDIDLFVNVFYTKLLCDNTINYIFTDVVKINVEKHIFLLLLIFGKAFYSTEISIIITP